MRKTIKIRAMISTNPMVEGRYFLTMNDVTGGRDHQITTRTLDKDEAIEWLALIKEQAERFEIELTVEDETKELGI